MAIDPNQHPLFLSSANEQIASVRKASMSENARLQAGFRKAELTIQCLERTVEQKTKENEELTAICDELINKVGAES